MSVESQFSCRVGSAHHREIHIFIERFLQNIRSSSRVDSAQQLESFNSLAEIEVSDLLEGAENYYR